MKVVNVAIGEEQYDFVCYQDEDFTEEFQQIISEAKELWREKIQSWIDAREVHPFWAVTRAGIRVWHLPKGHRKPKSYMILRPPLDPQNQCAWLDGGREVETFLQAKGIHCYFDPGRDD